MLNRDYVSILTMSESLLFVTIKNDDDNNDNDDEIAFLANVVERILFSPSYDDDARFLILSFHSFPHKGLCHYSRSRF